MKFRLKLIASTILSLLILVCGYQTYWLLNFYNEEYNKMDTIIENAIEDCSMKEMAKRVELITWEKTQGTFVEPRTETIEDYGTVSLSKDEASFSSPVKKDSTENSESGVFPEDFATLTNSLKKGMALAISYIKPVNIFRFDSIFSVELAALRINIPYVIEQKNIKNDSIGIIIPAGITGINKDEYKEYPMDLLEGTDTRYNLYLENPRWFVFRNMSGLVTISVLMVILLIASYVYLLRIILRQKTIDEIKGDFINNMTHELKTPISVTYAAIDALQNFGISDDIEKRDEYLTISKEQLMYLNSLVEQILTMSVEERRNLRLSLEDINIKDIFESQKNQFLVNANKPIRFSIDVKPENLTVYADRLHFGNVISNLIENAVKYSGENVEIKLSAGKAGKSTIISVCDSGIGIPHAALDKIFDKFYRVSTGNIHDVKGYGLGLFYVKTITDKHSWQIKAESAEGKGTCFKIIIP